jgi:hypothetical protein
MLPHSHAVLNTQVRQTACLTVAARKSDGANTAIANSCNHHSAWPCRMPKTGISKPNGHARLSDCTQPATKRTANCMGLSSLSAIYTNMSAGMTLNHFTAPPLVCKTVKLRPFNTMLSPRLGT